MSDRAQRPVLVTGASKGIGRAVALRLGREGYPVTVHYGGDRAGAETTQREIEAAGGKAMVIGFDTTDRAKTATTLEAHLAAHGPFWGVVQNAGIARDRAFPAIEGEDWDIVLRTNLDGFYNVLHPLMIPMIRRRDGGRVIAMSSVSGVIGNRGQVNYSASKAGVIGAAKALAVELASRKITVNCVAPGLIETAMTEDVREEVLAAIPMKRVGQVDEVSGLVAFLMSDEAAYITRQVIGVNGGIC
ncbi:MAG: 3-oxoacyl-ACP reductase FabG [Hyphomonadaceae bacterium]|nr:3-oxoacyl-ACP reductase FabG [Hyphomonadaceae bacterium]